MAIFRRRLIFWLLKAYIKRWGKVIVLSFFGGLLIFFLLISTSRFLVHLPLPIEKQIRIGMVGAYTIDTLPTEITKKLSSGLTRVSSRGDILPDVASSWEVKESGKTYIFYLDNNHFFSDGRRALAKDIVYNFSDVSLERPNNKTLIFRMSQPYAPFLVTVSRPIFAKGYVGLGDYKINDIELNGDFIKTLTIVSVKNKYISERYSFYPSEEALKLAFAMGEVSKAVGLTSISFKDTKFSSYPDVSVERKTDYTTLVSLFYNSQDANLSDRRIRSALSYSLPDEFIYGERTFVPYAPHSTYLNTEHLERRQDLAHAKVLLSADGNATVSAGMKISLKTLTKYRKLSEEIKKSWEKVGLSVTIEEVDSVPSSFQVFLGEFTLPKDPDQYTLWHSKQPNNITRYDNKRIDKLLEDGRRITDIAERKKIYNDFQKYFLDDPAASFLYFPYEYDVKRK